MATERENNLGMEFLKSGRAVTSCPGTMLSRRTDALSKCFTYDNNQNIILSTNMYLKYWVTRRKIL